MKRPAAIRRFLDSKTDASTRQGFKIGAKGFLNEAPTLRTFLLDYLGQIDPAAAAEYARVILNSKDSPDEWAVALRNLAMGDPSADGRALLQQKAGEMLQYGPWQQNPSTGYLEAFDVAVYLGGTSLVPALTELVRKQDNPAVAHAAYLALDRLAINESAALLGALAADPDLMQGREQTRANYFARADVRDPQQRQVLENLSARPSNQPAGIAAVRRAFPECQFHGVPEPAHPDADARPRRSESAGTRPHCRSVQDLAGGPAVCEAPAAIAEGEAEAGGFREAGGTVKV